MKIKFNFFNIMAIIVLSLFIHSCRTEATVEDLNENSATISKVDTTGVYKMKEKPIFKNYLRQKLLEAQLNSTEYLTVLEDEQSINVINRNNKISYNTLVNKGNSTFQYLVYTKKENKEQLIIIELISDNEMQYLDLPKFTGTVLFKSLNGNLLGTERFEKGKPYKNKLSKSICGSVTTAISCIEGLHFPGQPCAWAGSTGAAYYDTEIIQCNEDAEYINPNWGGGGSDGGGGNGINPYYLVPVDALNHYFQLKGGNSLTTEQINFLNNNFNIANELKYYFLNDENYPNSPVFLHWTIDFFRQNPGTNWIEFKNWFITRSEGPDGGEYNDGISDDIFSQQTFQQYTLPSMSNYELAFPSKPNLTYPNYYRDAQPNNVVYNDYIGGRLKQLFNQNGGSISTNPYYNACAARQSYALNKLGIMIPFQHNDLKGNNNWNYILMASKMGIFLEKTFGAPTYKLEGANANNPTEIAKFLRGKTGIYLAINDDFVQAGYTGHTDMIKNGYVSGGANVTGVHGGIKYIYIWELN